MKALTIICILICFLSSVDAVAQEQEGIYSLKQLSVNEGLSHSDVTAIVQDDLGYLWIGTNNGLNRYDGRTVKSFKADPFDLSSLPDSKITTLYKDKRGYIWIGTQHHGLCYYHPETETFKRLDIPTDDLWISTISENTQGQVWVATRQKGVYLIDMTSDSQMVISDHVLTKFSGNQTILTMVFTSADEMVFATFSNIYSFHYPSGTIFKINLPSKTIAPQMVSDYKGGLYVGNNNALYQLQPQKKGRHAYHVTDMHLSKPIQKITSLFLDKQKTLWIGTLGNGLYQLNQMRTQSDHPIPIIRVTNSTVSENFTGSLARVNCIFEDKYGLLWLGSSAGGAAYFNKGNHFFKLINNRTGKQYLPSNYVNAIFSEAGRFIIGTRNGLAILNPGEKPSFMFSNVPITVIYKDQAGHFWIGSNGYGVKEMRYLANKLEEKPNPVVEGLLRNAHISSITEDHQGRLWIGTFGKGIQLLSADRQRIEPLRKFDQTSGLTSDQISYIYRDPRYPLMWVSTRDGGVDCFSLDNDQPVILKNYRYRADQAGLSSNFAWPIIRSNDSTIWIGTLGGGLNGITRHASGKESIRHVTVRNGIVDNDVESMELDKQGNLWIGGYGITKFDPHSGRTQFFDYKDGLQSNAFKVGASYQDAKGTLYFGGINGFNYFSPDSVGQDVSPPDMVLTDLRIFDVPMQPDKTFRGKNILSQPIQYTHNLVLPASLNNFTLYYEGIQLAASGKIKFHYQLEGYNEKYVTSMLPSASFSNLKAGTYRFKVKASLNNVYSKERMLTIQVLPSWWLSWWAYLLYALLVFLSFTIYRYILTNRNKLKNELILAAKDKSLNEEKLEFFTHISHELKTPLSLIYSPVTELLESNEPISNTVSKEKLQLIRHHSERLMALAHQLIDLKKIGAGHLHLKATKNDIVKFIKEIWLLFKQQAESRSIAYHFSTEEESIALYFDAEKLQLVFSNLLMNAFKYTPEGGSIRINVYIKGDPKRAAAFAYTSVGETLINHYLEVVIEDSGTGIPEDQLAHIFETYYHTTDTQSLQMEGTGLGLSIAKGILEKHRGFIRVESQVGIGSRFIVALPFGKAHVPSHQLIVNQTDPEDVSQYQLDRDQLQTSTDEEPLCPPHLYTLLLVEDHAALLNYLSDVFAKNFRVITAKNGAIGLEKAKLYFPDLIISDVMMPEMDGLEMCRKLKSDAETNFIPIILLTARTASLYELEGIHTGADDYISKPFNIQLLRAKINTCLQNRLKVKEYYSKLMASEEERPVINTADEVFIHRVIDTVEQNLQDKDFGILPLASALAMSKSALFKRIKDITGTSPVDFIRSLRLRKAETLLREGKLNISEVAFQVGMNDLKYFREQFKKRNNVSPSEYVRQFRKSMQRHGSV